jgi:hypothetical protein
MLQSPRNFYLSYTGPYFAALLLLAVFTFWPSYVSLPRSASSPYTHFHALIATLWMLMLIAQPMLMRAGKMKLHRKLGKASWVLGPLFIVAAFLLAHHRIATAEGPAYAVQTYILWLQFSIGGLFTLSWVLAMANRHNMPVHARFMICTGLTLIDPVVIRLWNWIGFDPNVNYQWFTFGLTDALFLGLIWMERKAPSGRWVFPVMLGVFFLAQIPALFGLTDQAWWQTFARWFAGLPLT